MAETDPEASGNPALTASADLARARGPFAGSPDHLDAPFQATPAHLVERMLDLAQVGPGDRLVDLGCGDGRIVVAAALRGVFACGIDIDGERIAEAQAAARTAGVSALARFEQGDLFALDLSGFDVVTLFLLPHVNRWLLPKLRGELRPGARVVGHAFPMPDWGPAGEISEGRTRIYLWRVPDPESG